MGKGQIIANLGDGEYTLKILYNRTQLNAMISRLAEQISAAETLISDYIDQLNTQQADKILLENALATNQNQLESLQNTLTTYQSDLAELTADRQALDKEIASLQGLVSAYENAIDAANAQISQNNDTISDLTDQAAALPDGPEKDAILGQIAALNAQNDQLDADTISYQSLIDLYEEDITEIQDVTIPAKDAEITAKENQINNTENDIATKQTAIDTKETEISEKQNDITHTQALIDGKELYITSLEKRKEVLQALPEDPTISAWCADLTDDLSGDVATIEPYGELSLDRTLIRPGYDNNHIWNADRDGQLQFVKAMTPAQAFYNLAMLPGWQTWMPTYRIGTITAIDHDSNTCSLTIETARSSQQQLVISGWPTLTDVAFDYMSCNSAAFEVGDKVVVEYRNRSASEDETPYVIGFETNPVGCCVFFETFDTGAFNYTWGYTGNFSGAPGSYLIPPSWTESVVGLSDKIDLEFTYSGGTSVILYDPDDPQYPYEDRYFTSGQFSYGNFRSDLSTPKVLADEAWLIIEITVAEMKQDPYSYAFPNNRAKIDITVAVEGLYEGEWALRYASLRFNISSAGVSGVFAGDILSYLAVSNPWAEQWRLVYVTVSPSFMVVLYPDSSGSPTPTDPIDARIAANIAAIKICGSSPEGATIGNIINPSSGTSVSF